MIGTLFQRLIRLLISAALCAPVWGVALSSSAASAADDTNIPGVSLPGPVVTGRLGGPIYDHVYSIDVPAGRVVLLSLSGDPGTDFDLYLFGQSATTIYANDAIVAFSTGSTSTEALSYAAAGGGRFYIDINGASDVEGAFRLTVRFVADTAPPMAKLLLDEGAVATSDSSLRVSLVATDDLSGVTDMQVSLDGHTWDDWRPYVPFSVWSFPQVDGPISMAARVRDRAGNVSATANAAIIVNTVPPAVVSRTPEPNAVTDLRPTISVVFSEPILSSSWSSQGLLLQDSQGASVQGTYSYDPDARMGSFKPSTDLAAGVQYVATLGPVTDAAGNAVAGLGSWVIRPLRGRTVTLAPERTSLTYGSTFSLRGSIDLPVDGAVTVERSVAGAPWNLLGAVAPDAAGRFELTTRAGASARYRVHVAASSTGQEQVGSPVNVTVHQRVALQGISAALTRQMAVGSSVSLRAVAGPSTPPRTLTMSAFRRDPLTGRYLLVSTVRRGTVGGVAAFTWRPLLAGSYYLRFTVPATSLLASGTSPTYKWTVTS